MIYRIEIRDSVYRNFRDYCKERKEKSLDNFELYAKIALEFKGKYYLDRSIAVCDIIEFDTSEDLLRFKLQFT